MTKQEAIENAKARAKRYEEPQLVYFHNDPEDDMDPEECYFVCFLSEVDEVDTFGGFHRVQVIT